MDAGGYLSAAGAVVAAVAAGVGWWQARSAKRAVKVAEEQVNVMRDQLTLERSLRDDGIRPRFEVAEARTMLLPRGEGRLALTVSQIAGVPLDNVKVELYVGDRQIVPDESDSDNVYTCPYSSPGSVIAVRAHLGTEVAQASAIRIELSGTEARGTRVWSERLVSHPATSASGILFDRDRPVAVSDRHAYRPAADPDDWRRVLAFLAEEDSPTRQIHYEVSREFMARLLDETDTPDREDVIEYLRRFTDLHIPGIMPELGSDGPAAEERVLSGDGTGTEEHPGREGTSASGP